MAKRPMPSSFTSPCSLWRAFADFCSTCGAAIVGAGGSLLALVPVRSYDPIRCQEPQWPRRPLAIGRRGLPLTRPGPPPACHRRLRLSLISADTVLSARTPFLRRGSPSLSRRMRRAPRAQRNGGYPRKAARLAGTGAMSIPRPPGTSCRGPRATSRARPRWPRWPSPRACRGRASPRAAAGAARTPSSRASLSRGARPCPSA